MPPMTKESEIQIACNQLLNELKEIYIFRHFHVANEGKRSVQYLIKLKKMGFRAGVPDFIIEYPNAKILYMVRDPLNVIPSGLSLVTGVLDKRFGFWGLDKKIKDRNKDEIKLQNKK